MILPCLSLAIFHFNIVNKTFSRVVLLRLSEVLSFCRDFGGWSRPTRVPTVQYVRRLLPLGTRMETDRRTDLRCEQVEWVDCSGSLQPAGAQCHLPNKKSRRLIFSCVTSPFKLLILQCIVRTIKGLVRRKSCSSIQFETIETMILRCSGVWFDGFLPVFWCSVLFCWIGEWLYLKTSSRTRKLLYPPSIASFLANWGINSYLY